MAVSNDTRRALIQQTADSLAAVTGNAMISSAPLADFPIWLDVLGVTWFHARLRVDGSVAAHTVGEYRGCWIQVHTTAHVLRGMELPPHDSDELADRLPATEVHRLESLASSVEVAS